MNSYADEAEWDKWLPHNGIKIEDIGYHIALYAANDHVRRGDERWICARGNIGIELQWKS